MPEVKPPKTIHQQFLELPEKVRDWLTSERVTYTIIEINKKLDLFGNLLTVIPNLITKLATKNLDPKNFIKELGDDLGLDDDQAQEVGREVVEKILRPIDLSLKEAGVFIGLIYAVPSEALAKEGRTPSQQIPPTPPSPPSLTRQSGQQPPTPPLIQTKEAAHPAEIQSKVIPIPVKRPPQPPIPPVPPLNPKP